MHWQSQTRGPSRPHQVDGTNALITHPKFALFDDVGGGKSKQVIDAAFALAQLTCIDAVLVLTPGSARSVWVDPDPALGEVAKWGWPQVPFGVREYHTKYPRLPLGSRFEFVVTNYEFIRRKERLMPLLEWVKGRRVLLVCDESWMVANPQAQQTKATVALSQAAARAVILNGTPGDPGKLYAQFAVLNRNILGYKNYFAFRNHYAKMGGWMNKKIVGWEHMDEFQSRTSPYVLRRKTRDVFALGDPPTRLTIDDRLTPITWRAYEGMRDDLAAWLDTPDGQAASIAGTAGIRMLRLSQITAGFVGGVEWELAPDLFTTQAQQTMVQVGSEKLDAVKAWLDQNGTPKKLVLWGAFRREIETVAQQLQESNSFHTVRKLYGGQSEDQRREVKSLLAPGGDPRPAIVVGHPRSGGAGLHFGAASVAIYLTNGYSVKDRLQSEGRIDRPGQVGHPLFIDVLAHGPDGQKTVDHHIVAALRRGEDIGNWTAAAWKRALGA